MRSATRVSAVLFGAFLFVVLASVSVCFAEEEGFVLISGHAFLGGASDHSGIRVLFQAVSPSAVTDSAFTDNVGNFSLYVQVGIYDVSYSKDGYKPYSMCQQFYTINTNLPDVTLEPGTPPIPLHVSGNVRGRWTDTYVYFVDGDVVVPEGDTLLIDPGVTIRFTGRYKFESRGLLLAQGAEGDSITFTSDVCTPASGDWVGISIFGADTSNVLAYCHVKGAEIGISCHAPLTRINNSTLDHNGQGIRAPSGSVAITDCVVQNNALWGVDAYNGHLTMTACVIQGNGAYGIGATYGATTITDCVIRENASAGITTYDVSLTVTGCVVEHNGLYGLYVTNSRAGGLIADCIVRNNPHYGVYWNGYYGPVISGCVIANAYSGYGVFFVPQSNGFSTTIERCALQNNSAGAGASSSYNPQIEINSSIVRENGTGLFQVLSAHHCDFFGNTTNFSAPFPPGIGNIVTTNANGDSCDTYLNIYLDPRQVDPANGDYHLLSDSPCIDAGDPTLAYDPDGTIADMGGYYFNQGTPPPAPVADLNASPLSGPLPLAVTFTNLSTGAITGYSWSFGDGTTSQLRDPLHIYTQPGTYTVALTATGPGGSDTETKTNYIEVLPAMMPPAADFAGSPTSGYAPLEVTFTNLTTGSVDSLRWYFGDGASSNVEDPVHVYAAADTYTVRLVAYGPYGTDQETKTDYIKVRTLLQDAPTILSLVDVPHDQGGWIYLSFARSAYDFADETDHPVTDYFVYRRIDDPVLQSAVRAKGLPLKDGDQLVLDIPGQSTTVSASKLASQVLRFEDNYYIVNDASGSSGPPPGTWAVVGSAPAHQQDEYTVLTPTVADSSSTLVYSVYTVSAETTIPSIYFFSAPDSGYSVDNLKPAAPQGLNLQANMLAWSAVPDDDFNFYAVYVSETQDFSSSTLVGTTVELSLDVSGKVGKYVAVTAKDFAGNESELSEVLYVDPIGVNDGEPTRFALHGNIPNPFNPTTSIRYELASHVHVSLRVFDVGGQLIKQLVDEVAGPGTFTAEWDGTNGNGEQVSTGVYFCRLNAGSFEQTMKMVLLK